MNETRRSNVIVGLLLIVLGGMFLARQMYGWPDLEWRKLWPLVLIGAGLTHLTISPLRGHGFTMVGIGTLFLLDTHRVFRLRDSWPLFIVAVGVGLLVGGRPKHHSVSDGQDHV